MLRGLSGLRVRRTAAFYASMASTSVMAICQQLTVLAAALIALG